MEIRADHYDMSGIKTVRDVLSRASAVARDTKNYPGLGSSTLLDCLTEAAYPHGMVSGSGVVADPQYKHHQRVRKMDLKVQAELKKTVPDLFREGRGNRMECAELLDRAVAACQA